VALELSQHILQLVYKSMVESVLTFHLTAWYDPLNCRSMNILARIVTIASIIVGRQQRPLVQLYAERVKKEARSILTDSSHPLFRQFKAIKLDRHYRTPLANKNMFNRSFIPNAVKILNSISK